MSFWWGKSKSTMPVFVWTLFGKLFWKRGKSGPHKNRHSIFGFSLPRVFQLWSWICCIRVFRKYFFVDFYWGLNPAIAISFVFCSFLEKIIRVSVFYRISASIVLVCVTVDSFHLHFVRSCCCKEANICVVSACIKYVQYTSHSQ